jgi:hypothetical protein
MFGIGKKLFTPVEDPEGIAIKVMPEEFYSKKGAMSKPISNEVKTVVSKAPAAPSAPSSPAAPSAPPVNKEIVPPIKQKKPTVIIVLIVVTVLLIIGAGYLFIQSLNVGKEKEVPPAAKEEPKQKEEPPSPVCGDGKCDEGETSSNCLSDCPLPPPPEPPPPVIPRIAPDTDGDGLTDIEEDIFGVGRDNLDTDNDGYRDGLEIINLYNPAGFAPQKIEETSLVKIYNNASYNFRVFYPESWLAKALDETDKEVMITSATGEFIQIIVEENKDNLPLLDWYLIKAPEVNPADVTTAKTKSGLLGVKSPDGLKAYFGHDNKIFAISYNIGTKTELNYKSIFEMIIRSFRIDSAASD